MAETEQDWNEDPRRKLSDQEKRNLNDETLMWFWVHPAVYLFIFVFVIMLAQKAGRGV